MDTLNKNRLEEMMQIAEDTRKVILFDQFEGSWSWCDRCERDILDAHHTGFATFLDALEDAVEPYMGEGSEE